MTQRAQATRGTQAAGRASAGPTTSMAQAASRTLTDQNQGEHSHGDRAWEGDAGGESNRGDNGGSRERPKTRPVHEVRFGRIVAAVWENRGEQGVRYNVTVCKIYKSGDQWRETQSFGRDELPLVIKVLDHCHTWIYTHPSKDGDSTA